MDLMRIDRSIAITLLIGGIFGLASASAAATLSAVDAGSESSPKANPEADVGLAGDEAIPDSTPNVPWNNLDEVGSGDRTGEWSKEFSPPPRLHLVAGETRALPFRRGISLKVSRRGILDVHASADGDWQATALHAGIVLIEAKDEPDNVGRSEAVQSEQRLLVEVSSIEAAARPRRNDTTAKVDDTLAPWICATPGIQCDLGAKIITGRAPTWTWLVQADAVCSGQRLCLLQTTLAPEERVAWTAALKATTPDARYGIEVAEDGFVHITTPCPAVDHGGGVTFDRESPVLPLRLLPTTRLIHHCGPDYPGVAYQLKARIYLVEASSAKELGFDGLATMAVGARPASAEARLISRLTAMANARRLEVIGEPSVRLLPGREAKVSAGGEFQVVGGQALAGLTTLASGALTGDKVQGESDAVDRLSRLAWKEHGLDLTLTAVPLDDKRARLAFAASLKERRQDEGDPSLSSSSVKSAVDLVLGEAKVAAVLDVDSRGTRMEETPVFAKIPLIGPLFRKKGRDRASSHLVLTMTLERDNGG